MRLLYCDETNFEERRGDFFVYGGMVIDGARAKELSQAIDRIRAAAGIDRLFKLKFSVKPEDFPQAKFNALKQAMIEAAIAHGAKFLCSVILHDIAESPDIARRNEINRVAYHFDCLLERYREPGLVLIDRFSDRQIDAHLVEKFSVGITGPGLPHSHEMRLNNIVGFHYSAIGQSHFPCLIDIVLGSVRFCINAFTRGDAYGLRMAAIVLPVVQPLFHREPAPAAIHEISFFFSPKTVAVARYRERYAQLKQFLAEHGMDTAQAI